MPRVNKGYIYFILFIYSGVGGGGEEVACSQFRKSVKSISGKTLMIQATAIYFFLNTNHYSFIRRANCERARVCFHSNVSAVVSRIRALCYFVKFQARRSPPFPKLKGVRTPIPGAHVSFKPDALRINYA